MTAVAATTGITLFVLLVAPIVAWPLTRVLLRRYRRALLRMMHRSAKRSEDIAASADPADELSPARDRDGLGAPSSPDHADPTEPAVTSVATLLTRSDAGRRRLVLRYALAGTAFSVVLASATLLATAIPLTAIRLLALTVQYLWPLTITVAIASGFDRRWWVGATAAYGAVLVVTGMVGHVPGELIVGWALLNLPATVLVVPFLHPTVRAVGVVVLAFVVVGLAGAVVLTNGIGVDADRMARVADLLSPLRISGRVAFSLLLATGFVLAGVAGWLWLRGVARAYRARGLPDQLLLVGGVWAFFAAYYAIPLAFYGLRWPVSGVAAFALFWLIAGRARHTADAPPGPRLLLLRVFALEARGERMFRRIATDWEHIGPIRLVGGPDLARATVEPDEFLAFVSGGFERLFVTDPQQVSERLRLEPLGRDRLGRFRVQEFLCFDDTWRAAVRTLLRATDLVVMDARGFGAGNDGARHELTELARERMLQRTTILVDPWTDQDLMAVAVGEGDGQLADAHLVDVTDDRPLLAQLVVSLGAGGGTRPAA